MPSVVFLDIDGVLNHTGVYAECAKRPGQTDPDDWIDPECVARLDTLCAATSASLVISSSWRIYLKTAEGVAKVLRTRGLRAPVVGATPSLAPDSSGLFPRWREIETWLAEHPEVTSYVIVDDTNWPLFPPSRFVRTNPATGLTDADVARAIWILTEGPARCWRALRSEVLLASMCRTAKRTGLAWQWPHCVGVLDSEVLAEWWMGERKLSIYVTSEGADFVQSSVHDQRISMVDGAVEGPGHAVDLWRWLVAA